MCSRNAGSRVLFKYKAAWEELLTLTSSLMDNNANRADDTAGKTFEDGSAALEKESVNNAMSFIEHSVSQLMQLPLLPILQINFSSWFLIAGFTNG